MKIGCGSQPLEMIPSDPRLLASKPFLKPSAVLNRAELCDQQNTAGVMTCDFGGRVTKGMAASALLS